VTNVRFLKEFCSRFVGDDRCRGIDQAWLKVDYFSVKPGWVKDQIWWPRR